MEITLSCVVLWGPAQSAPFTSPHITPPERGTIEQYFNFNNLRVGQWNNSHTEKYPRPIVRVFRKARTLLQRRLYLRCCLSSGGIQLVLQAPISECLFPDMRSHLQDFFSQRLLDCSSKRQVPAPAYRSHPRPSSSCKASKR